MWLQITIVIFFSKNFDPGFLPYITCNSVEKLKSGIQTVTSYSPSLFKFRVERSDKTSPFRGRGKLYNIETLPQHPAFQLLYI